MKSIRLNDTGTVFKITVKDPDGVAIDISSATTKQFIFQKPDRTLLTKTASFFTDGSDGILTYTSTSGVIDAEGIWNCQVYVVITAGSFRSNKIKFKVEDILN